MMLAIKNFKTEDNVPAGYKKNMIFLCILKVTEERSCHTFFVATNFTKLKIILFLKW
jgi:hypothetical protein